MRGKMSYQLWFPIAREMKEFWLMRSYNKIARGYWSSKLLKPSAKQKRSLQELIDNIIIEEAITTTPPPTPAK